MLDLKLSWMSIKLDGLVLDLKLSWLLCLVLKRAKRRIGQRTNYHVLHVIVG